MDELRKMLLNYPMLTPEDIDLIVENANVKSFKKGSVLLREGQVSKECYSVLKGIVREYYMVDGDEKTTAFYTEGQAVNAFTSFTQDKPSKHFLVCASDCVLTVGNEALEAEMCRRIPKLESIIRKEVEKLTGKTQDDFATFMTSTPEQRYLNLMETRPDLLNRIPQHQIASYLGITAESLSRIRKRIFSKNIIN
ncbi:Crp/Fnr family transcriptional regulator [Labilibacter sediminis]|nr:Crp/Fnr family transcriptional regulator [Labilibacter sediminis]